MTWQCSSQSPAARKAWVDARVPYLQSEAFRFTNPLVDAWEGKVNAWPLDEGLIDYVASIDPGSDNRLVSANVVASKVLTIDDRQVDAGRITAGLLRETLHEAGGLRANVATGWHAIEFLLWGQDLNGTTPIRRIGGELHRGRCTKARPFSTPQDVRPATGRAS